MPYLQGNRLSGERASKLGHLEVLKSELVNRLVNEFDTTVNIEDLPKVNWKELPKSDEVLQTIFCVDGSLQTITSGGFPKKELSFIKTALLTLDQKALDEVDPDYPHPFALKNIMKDSALYHSTVLPLRRIKLPELNSYHTVRRIIYESFLDPSFDREVMKTLKWLIYAQWTKDKNIKSLAFQCPYCDIKIEGLENNTEVGVCPHCQQEVYITDILGFHLDMQDDAVPIKVSTSYMLIHEMILLFTPIRFFWESKNYVRLNDTLFLKDGPLSLNSQYSKLVPRIRDFIVYAQKKNVIIHLAGQEKSGRFVEYLELLSVNSPEKLAYFIPKNEFIDKEIRERDNRKDPYGLRVNYGNKIFVCNDKYHHVVLSIPTGEYKNTDNIEDFIGAKKIINTLHKLISHKHENALLPIQLANGIASLSTYPSAQVLKLFSSKLLD